MVITSLKTSLGIAMLATATASYQISTSPSANWMNATLTAGVVVIGIVAVMNLVGKKAKRRRRVTSLDESDSTISVEGSVIVTLPTWAIVASNEYFSKRYRSDEEMMSLAIHLSDRNITEGTGGPFGSAIFERHEDKCGGSYCTLTSIGMNRVVPLGNSTLHGEVRFLHTCGGLLRI